jgi:tRNA threonylcarbamoyladenosine biosynthesis protein TsaB
VHTLGISCATKLISLGIIDEQGVRLETSISEIQAERIMFYVKESGIKPEEIDGIAITIGPGSYSGLRAGLATAKTLAQTLSLPLMGISTLETIAYNLVEMEGTIVVLLDARMDEYNFALFGASAGKMKRLTEDLVLKWEVLIERLAEISGKIWVVGNTRPLKEIRNWPENIRFAEEIHAHPYGVNVARLGMQKKEAGFADDPLTLTPHYSHKISFKEYK